MNTPPPQVSKEFDLWKILGLKDSEIKIIESISKIAKPAAIISRHTGISDTTISYTLKKLKKRDLIKFSDHSGHPYWRSNIPKIILQIKNLPLPSRKNSTRQKSP